MRKIMKKIVIGGFSLYLFNAIAVNFGLIIGINVVTILIAGFLGFPGLLSMVLIALLNFN